MMGRNKLTEVVIFLMAGLLLVALKITTAYSVLVVGIIQLVTLNARKALINRIKNWFEKC